MKESTEQPPTAQLSRDEQILAYFVRKCGSKKPLGRTQLVKLAYLVDHEARRYLGRPLSDLNYYWHFFGPYDDEILTTIHSLQDKDIIREEQVVYPTGQKGYEYKKGTEDEIRVSLQPIEIEILRYVCTTYADLKLSALLGDVVYETAPMKAAIAAGAKGEPLDMNVVNDERRFEYGISFEELFDRIQEVRAGRGIPHAKAVAELRASIVDNAGVVAA